MQSVDHAVPLCQAFLDADVKVIEIALQTDCALETVEHIRKECPDMIVGIGNIDQTDEMQQAIQAGAQFLSSPGITRSLLEQSSKSDIPYIPAIASPSEIMLGLEFGLHHFKFLPAVLCGGVHMLEAFTDPFPQAKFCPTGGINEANYLDYLDLPNVLSVGGSWVCKQNDMENERWVWIGDILKRALKLT